MQIVISLCLYAEALTGGAMGLNGIPKLVSNWQLVLAVAVVAYIYHQSGRSGLGRAFDVMREDEAVAAAIGIDVGKHHAIAFALSGAIAGFAGALIAYDTYSLSAQQFGFSFLVAALASVIVGGQRSTAGPIFGASLLTVLPELIRPLADQRLVLNGVILMVVMVFLPNGVVDTLVDWSRATRLTRIRRRTDAA
jgi:branched-chain amino acid transport system permease protein